MLQQTLVATVVPYFNRFLSEFPTITSLAHASEQDLLRQWSGLGYYARVRNLHRAAKTIVADYDSKFPEDSDGVSRLPGFGRYTTNAVLSQAFDRRLPILEANSQRLLCRLFAIEEDVTASATRKKLWELSASLLPAKRCGDFNQALMELGAVVCTPITPACHSCPLRSKCLAHQRHRQEELPFRSPPPETVDQREAAVVVRRRGKVLLAQRPQTGRWANMWEFPHGQLRDAESPEAAATRLLSQLTGMTARIGAELTTIRHTVTRFRITMTCFLAQRPKGRFRSDFYQNGRWVDLGDLSEYPLSSPQRRVAKRLTDSDHGRARYALGGHAP